MKMKLIALAVSMIAFNASATSKDCGCTKSPTAYDKTQDVKISGNTSAIGDVKLTAGQAFDIAVEGRATASNALTTVYGLIPQVNNNAKGIADLQESKVDKSVFTADQQRQDKALADSVTKQAATDAKQTTDLKSYADKKATSAYQTSVAHTDVKVARADADRKAGDDELGARIDSTVADQSVRDAGQDAHINAVQGAAQSANEKADAGAVRMDGIEHQAGVLGGRVGGVEVRADKTEQDIRETHVQMDSDRQQRVDGDRMLAGRADAAEAVSANHETRITQNSSDIVQLYSNGEYAQSRIDAANANIEANRSAMVSSNKLIAANTAQLANHEQRLNDMQQQSNRQFADMGKRIDKVQDKANAGTATALAAAGIPQVTGEQRFSLGAAVGGYESENALAVGFSSRVSQNVVVKASVATDTQHGVGYNVGASVGW